ncbi:MAG: hypothetical protein WCD20_04495 [Rhodomicrobium sp.]
MNLANLEEQRASLARQIDLMKTGRMKVHMVGENGTSPQTIRAFEEALANMDHQIASEKHKLS